jgi:hypothetical protein
MGLVSPLTHPFINSLSTWAHIMLRSSPYQVALEPQVTGPEVFCDPQSPFQQEILIKGKGTPSR